MKIFLLFCLFICLFSILYQDLKNRHIHIIFPVIIFTVSYTISNTYNTINHYGLLMNVGFLIIILSILTCYMSIKNKSFQNPFLNYFGLGDLLFFASVSPLFILHNYILFFILSMLFSIVLQVIIDRKKKDQNTIPLAGFASLLLMLLVVKDLVIGFGKITIIK